MLEYAEIFFELGFNVLIPDNRGHGKSEGKYVGFGWLDRKDYVGWIDRLFQEDSQIEEIILFGISMGEATVMMTSGEVLPKEVKLVIADCDYDVVSNEFSYQLKRIYKLPRFPIIPLTSFYTKLKAGYSFYEASTVKQLKKNSLPLLLIHGEQDDFVPLTCLNNLYQATKGTKEKVIFQGARHAESFQSNRLKYVTVIINFLEKNL